MEDIKTLPQNKMYALRHGTTDQIWRFGVMWLWPSVSSIAKAWRIAKDVGLVQSNFKDHNVVTIKLTEI